MIYENTVPGVFLKRYNRFAAAVKVGGREETVHVKNTGRLGELLVPGAEVTLQRADAPSRKTRFDLISVFSEGLGWVNIDSLVPNRLVRDYLMSGDFDVVKPEHAYGSSRIDFYMEKDGRKYLTEVKGCTLLSPSDRETGLFPDAPTERGVKHLLELAEAAKNGYGCSMAFVIQMNGVKRVLPNTGTHPEFARAMEQAAKAGVKTLCFTCDVGADRIEISGKNVQKT